MATFYEFFAGGGMTRAGLGPGWDCLFANDISPMKASAYTANWGGKHVHTGDVANVSVDDLPARPDLVWASFPCQDLSLAGQHRGLGHANGDTATRSGTFWPFWTLMRQLMDQGRAPRLIVLENVVGTLTSRGGADFATIGMAFVDAGYAWGVFTCDAKLFVPQSRPRVFFVAMLDECEAPSDVISQGPSEPWHSNALVKAVDQLPEEARRGWRWWRIKDVVGEVRPLASLIEERPEGVSWHSQEQTAKLIEAMNAGNRLKLANAMSVGERRIGAVYRRTRPHEERRVVRTEVRFDGLAGCLRTPSGGSSRQTIMLVEGNSVRSRLLSPREAARLMGLSDCYRLPDGYNDAYHLLGDGVCVPVVRHIAEHLLEPLLPRDAVAFTLAA